MARPAPSPRRCSRQTSETAASCNQFPPTLLAARRRWHAHGRRGCGCLASPTRPGRPPRGAGPPHKRTRWWWWCRRSRAPGSTSVRMEPSGPVTARWTRGRLWGPRRTRRTSPGETVRVHTRRSACVDQCWHSEGARAAAGRGMAGLRTLCVRSIGRAQPPVRLTVGRATWVLCPAGNERVNAGKKGYLVEAINASKHTGNVKLMCALPRSPTAPPCAPRAIRGRALTCQRRSAPRVSGARCAVARRAVPVFALQHPERTCG